MYLFIVFSMVALLLVAAIIINNSIIVKKNRIKQAFGSIDSYLLQRFDLIPNLIATVQKYANHEKELFSKITELRSGLKKQSTNSEKVELSNNINGVLASISVEDYPHLKADTQFLKLMYSFDEMEEQLSAARRAYNASVVDYNNKIEQFPASIIANIKNAKPEQVLETPEKKRQNINAATLFN
jgi:LemA protein